MAPKKNNFKFRLPVFLFIFYILISGFILAMSTGGFIINFKELGFSIVSSMQRGINSVVKTAAQTVTAIHDLTVLQKNYEILTEKLKDYEYLQRNNAEIRKENERLKEQLGIVQSLNKKTISAYVIGRDPNSLYSAITLDKGARDGIKKNMHVIAFQEGTIGLVGKIIEVGRNTSMLMPIYDFQCNVSARIQHTRDLGLITGMGFSDMHLTMKYIKKRVLEELQYGDIVVTSGENDNYEREIPIGTISKIKVLDYDTSLELEITPLIDFSRLETVIVVDTFTAGDNE